MLGEELVEKVLEDAASAGIDGKLVAILGFLEKMTLEPENLTTEDASALRSAGLTDQEIRDAIKVAFAFNLIDRLADSFGFAIPTEVEFAKGAKMISKFGYKM